MPTPPPVFRPQPVNLTTVEQRVARLEEFRDRQLYDTRTLEGELKGIRMEISNLATAVTAAASVRDDRAKSSDRWKALAFTVGGSLLGAALIWFAHMAITVQTAIRP